VSDRITIGPKDMVVVTYPARLNEKAYIRAKLQLAKVLRIPSDRLVILEDGGQITTVLKPEDACEEEEPESPPPPPPQPTSIGSSRWYGLPLDAEKDR